MLFYELMVQNRLILKGYYCVLSFLYALLFAFAEYSMIKLLGAKKEVCLAM